MDEGIYHLSNENQTEIRCEEFLRRSAVHDKALLKNVDQNSPFWNWMLDVTEGIAKWKQRVRNVVDLDESLFLPDSTNTW